MKIFIFNSFVWQKYMVFVQLKWKGLGFFDIWVMFHTLLRDVDPYIIIEQLWKIGMKTSELSRYKKSKHCFSRVLQLHSCIKDYFRRYTVYVLILLVRKEKKSYSIENNPPWKKFQGSGWGRWNTCCKIFYGHDMRLPFQMQRLNESKPETEQILRSHTNKDIIQ